MILLALTSAGELAVFGIISAITATISGWMARASIRADKRQDWRRQDEVAARLAKDNERTHAKLSEVRDLVDGGLTAQMRREIVAYKGHLVFMRAKARDAGDGTSDEEKSAIREMDAVVVDLQKSLDEREALIRANAQKAKEVALVEAAHPPQSISEDVANHPQHDDHPKGA